MPPPSHARPPAWALALVVAASLASGCATTKVSMQPAPRSFTARDYDGVYRNWTGARTSSPSVG